MKRGILLIFLAVLLSDTRSFGYESKGRRDPFVPLIGSGKTVSVELEDIVSIQDVSLEGIAISKSGKRVAMINGQMLKENEQIGNLVIKRIGSENVIVSIDDKEYSLSLPEEGGVKSGK